MSSPTVPPLFAGNPGTPEMQGLQAALEHSYKRPVSILDLHHLPAPNLTRRQQKQTELIELEDELSAIDFMIDAAALNPEFYPEQLRLLHADRARYQVRINQLLGALRQEGGPASA